MPIERINPEGMYKPNKNIYSQVVTSRGPKTVHIAGTVPFDEDGNVRSMSTQLVPSFGPYAGEIVYELTLRSNAEGDLLSFKYYDVSEDAVLNIAETYEFVINDIVGNLVEPVFYNIGSSDEECEDDDAAVAPFGCAAAAASFGCDFNWGGAPIGESCPYTCGTCPEDDACGVCEGDGSSCSDCAGTPNGDAEADCFGICNGDAIIDCVGSCLPLSLIHIDAADE